MSSHSSHEEFRGGHAAQGFPTSHVVGLVLSIAFTLIALWMVQRHVLTTGWLMFSILGFAILQIVVQLFFFMHVTESSGPRYHVTALTLGFFFTFVVIAGSIWIMTFGGYQAY